jgi:phosphate acetyltransferase
LSIDDDTYTTAMKVNQVPATITPKSERKIALAMGLFSSNVDIKTIEDRITSTSSHIITPMMFEYNLFERARLNRKKIVLPESQDERILRATEILLRREVVDIVLLGKKEEIEYKSSSLGLDISKAQIINPEDSPLMEEFIHEFYNLRKAKGLSLEIAKDAMAHSNYFATMMVYKGYADGMVSGAVHTTQDTIRPALQIIKTKPDTSIVSSLFFMCLDTKVLVYGDCAVNQDPNAQELAQIAISSADTAVMFGIEPKVAMLSYSTGSSGKGEDVEKVREATNIVKKMRPDILIEGPIQYDAAIDQSVAKTKLPNSKVAGQATVFIFPDLNTGNNTYKAVQRSSGAIAIGPVLQGLNKPVNDLSRGCLVADIVNTVAITGIQAQEEESK